MKAFVNHYEVLGLPNSASIEAIVKAYRYLAKIYHPDKNPSKSARAKFEEIQNAYEALKNPDKKKAYDNILEAKLEDIKRYEKQSKLSKQLAEDLLKREEQNIKNKIKEQQKAYDQQYEAKVSRAKQIEELLLQNTKKATKNFTVLVKWRHKSKLLYTKENLKHIFVQYGRIDDIVPIDGKHRAYIMFAHKNSVTKLLEDKEKFANDFRIKEMKDDKRKVEKSDSDCFLSTEVIDKIRMANEKRSFETIKKETGEGIKKKKVEEVIDPLDAEEFRKKEEEILRKLME